VGHQNIWSLAVLINGNGGNEILICYTVGDEGFKYFEIKAFFRRETNRRD